MMLSRRNGIFGGQHATLTTASSVNGKSRRPIIGLQRYLLPCVGVCLVLVGLEMRPSDDSIVLAATKGIRHAHGLNGKNNPDIEWQCHCDSQFSTAYSVEKKTDENSYAEVDAHIKSAEGLKDLSNRLGIDFQLADPKGYREWFRPGPVQSFLGPLPYLGKGFDPVCGQDDSFVAQNAWFRDNLKSTGCNTMPRERALAFVLADLLPNFSQAGKIMESSPNPHGISLTLRNMFGPDRYTGTQFSASVDCGQKLEGMNGDISLNLEDQNCIPDSTFDIVISQDVFEHIYDPAKAFKEIARTLKPGGFHIFTVPITSKNFGTFIFAERVDNAPPSPHGMTVQLHCPPEIHGNPMGEGGSLLTRQWGYDIVDFIRQTSGMQTTVVYIDSKELGIHDAEYRDVLVSRKAGQNAAFPTIWKTLEEMKCNHSMISCTTSTSNKMQA